MLTATLSCLGCGWRTVCGAEQLALRLRRLGLLRRAPHPPDEVVGELLAVHVERLMCDSCGAAGLVVLPRDECDSGDYWQQAVHLRSLPAANSNRAARGGSQLATLRRLSGLGRSGRGTGRTGILPQVRRFGRTARQPWWRTNTLQAILHRRPTLPALGEHRAARHDGAFVSPRSLATLP